MKVVLIFFLLATSLFSYVNVHPVTFDKRIDGRGEVQEYTLYNPTKNSLRYQIYLDDSRLEKSMKDWIELYPTTITLKPGGSGKFKVLARAPKGVPAGEYLVTVGIKEMGLPNNPKDSTASVQILTHLKMDIAGYVGELNPKVYFKDLNVKVENQELKFKGDIANVGERRGTLEFFLGDKNSRNQIYLGNLRLLRGEKVAAEKLNQKFLENFKSIEELIVKDSLNGKILYKEKIK
ncbi:hypothetical protein [Cetobacterium sp. ZOR0034]|uniref:COG1470 family protein n=1 Tax=Cetobacterium sp. ZOR0034 TaxID=1339239 RepID=UPI0006467652|nr:hypothetical protein [Cetobacterium sp. ZOR0034]